MRPALEEEPAAPGESIAAKPYNFRSDAEQEQIEMWARYLAVGDVSCLLRLALIFEKHGKPYRIHSETATSFSDLRKRPSILIGGFDNDWTLRALGEMRFSFYKDFQGLEMIHDRDHPENTEWKLVNSWPRWNIAQDYAIVSRVFDAHTNRIVVIAAGITHFGTAGAGDFLSNRQYLADTTAKLPCNWQHRNPQIVIRIPVVRGVAGHPQVLATHVW